MRKVIALTLISLITTTIFSETILVMDFDTEINSYENNAIIMSDMLRSELVKTGEFVVIDKKSMTAAISVMQDQMSDYMSDQNVKKLGKMLNADYLVIGHVLNLTNTSQSQVRSSNLLLNRIEKILSGSDKVEVIVQILDIETLQVLSSSSVELNKWTDYSQYLSVISNELTKSLKKKNDISSQMLGRIQTATADIFVGTWKTELCHDGIIDEYEIEFRDDHIVSVTVKSIDKKGNSTVSSGVGRFTFNDTDKILSITVNTLSGEIKHISEIHWKSFVSPSDEFDVFTFSIPQKSRENSNLTAVQFYKSE